MADDSSQSGALPSDGASSSAPSSDASTLVSNWFAANPNATNDQAAAAVQAYGGLTPDLTSALAAHYGTDTGTITSAYNNFLNSQTPTGASGITATNGAATGATAGSATGSTTDTGATGSTNTGTTSGATSITGSTATADSGSTASANSGVAASTTAESTTAASSSAASTSAASSSKSTSDFLSQYNNQTQQGIKVAGLDSVMQQVNSGANANDLLDQGYEIFGVSSYKDATGKTINADPNTYFVNKADGSGGSLNYFFKVDPSTGKTMAIDNPSQNLTYTQGSSGSVVKGIIGDIGSAINSLGPLGKIAVSIGLNAVLPGAGELGSYLTGAEAASTTAVTVGGAVIGATTGATFAALNGTDIVKGALTGAATGGAAANATSFVNSVINPDTISKSLDGMYTPQQVSSIVANSFVRAVAAGVAGGDTSKIMSTFTTGLIANGLGTSAAGEITNSFKGQISDSTLNSIAKTVGNVTNAATTSALSGGDKNAVNTAIIASLATSGAQAALSSSASTSANSTSGTTTVDKTKQYYDYAISQGKTPEEASLFAMDPTGNLNPVGFNSANAKIATDASSTYLALVNNPNATQQQLDDAYAAAQKGLSQAITNEISNPNTVLQSLGDNSYFDPTNKTVWYQDSSNNWHASDATVNKDGTVSYAQTATDGTAGSPLTGTPQPLGQNPNTVGFNFADLNSDQKSQYLSNIMANKSDTTGGATFTPDKTTPGLWDLPFNIIGHTTTSDGSTGNEVYQDDNGNKFTLAVVNGTAQEVPFDESKVTWVQNKTPTPVTTNIDPNTVANKTNTTDQTQKTDQTQQTQESNVSSSAVSSSAVSSSAVSSSAVSSSASSSSASSASNQSTAAASSSASSAAAASSSASSAASDQASASGSSGAPSSSSSSDSASAQAQKAQDAIKLLQSQNVQPSDIAAYLQQVLGYSKSDANNLIKASTGYNLSGSTSAGQSSAGTSSAGISSSGISSSGISSSGMSSSGVSSSGVSSSGASSSGTSSSGFSNSGTSSSGTSSSGISSSGSSSSGTSSSGTSSSGTSSSGISSSGTSSSGTSSSGTSSSGISSSGTSSSGISSSGTSSSGNSSSGTSSSGNSSSGSSSSGKSSSGNSSSGTSSSGTSSSGKGGNISSSSNTGGSISIGGGSSGSGGGTLPGNLLGTVLAGIPVAQREKIMKDLKQLYPQIAHIDPKTLETIQSGSKEASPDESPSGALPGAIPGMPVAPQPGTTTALSTPKMDNPLMQGNYSALTNAGLQLMSGNSGALPSFKKGGNVHVPEFITGATGHYVKGKGDGQSDDIPAMLADGEYVFDADTVAALGNGSSDAGAEVLDKMREAIRKHKRSAPVDKIPPKAKSPLEYLKGVK